MVDLNLRRLVVGSIAAGVLAYGMYIGLNTATGLSGKSLTMSSLLLAVFATRGAERLWDAKTKNN